MLRTGLKLLGLVHRTGLKLHPADVNCLCDKSYGCYVSVVVNCYWIMYLSIYYIFMVYLRME
jgi:hypothetical protein